MTLNGKKKTNGSNSVVAENLKQFEEAIKAGDLKTVDTYLLQGMDPVMNTPSFPAPILAALHGQREVLERFASNGLDLHDYRFLGMGLLCAAAKSKKPDALTYFIRAGLDLNGPCNNKGTSPLHSAIMRKCLKSIDILIDAGAEVNAQDAEGITPLMEAAKRNQAETVSLLLGHKADKKQRDLKGNNAFDLAIEAGAYRSASILCSQWEEKTLLDCSGNKLRLKSKSGHWKQFRGDIEENLRRLSTQKNRDGYYEIWSHHVDMVPAAKVKLFEESIGICQTGGGPGWKKLLESIKQWRKIFDNGLALERIQEHQEGHQGQAGTACIHENMMPLAERPGFKSVQWVRDTSWCPDCGALIVDFYDWHDGTSSVTYFPASADVLFNEHSDFTDVLAYLDSIDAATYSKIMDPARVYFKKAKYNHSSAWDALIHRLEGAEPTKTDYLLSLLYNILLSARKHFEGYVVDVPLHPPEMTLEGQAESCRKAFDKIEKELDEQERKKGTFAESPEKAAISLKTVTPVANILTVEGEGNRNDSKAEEPYRRKLARRVLAEIQDMDKRQLVFMAATTRQLIDMKVGVKSPVDFF